MVKKVDFSYDDGNLKESTEYDALGNYLKETNYNEDGSILNWSEWEYDASGNAIKTSYRADGRIKGWTDYEYEYYKWGYKFIAIRYNKDGSIMRRDEYWYDVNDKRIG